MYDVHVASYATFFYEAFLFDVSLQGFSSKFSEIQILLTSEENKNMHIFSK